MSINILHKGDDDDDDDDDINYNNTVINRLIIKRTQVIYLVILPNTINAILAKGNVWEIVQYHFISKKF